MSRCFFVFASLVVCMFPSVCSAQFAAAATGEIETITTADVRLAGDLDELPTGGLVGDENGGGTSLIVGINTGNCLLYTSPSPRDRTRSRMPSSA